MSIQKMSQDRPALSRKEKRAQRDAGRYQKGTKRKHAEVSGELAAHESNDIPFEASDASEKVSTPDPTQIRKKTLTTGVSSTTDSESKSNDAISTTNRRKKRQKSQREGPPTAKHRFLLFVGNLPYSTTDESLRLHFRNLEPFVLRHRIDKHTKRSKGFAFVEFDNFDRMQTCLKKYHHSIFDPETAGRDAKTAGEQANEDMGRKLRKGWRGRKINVELTAGGGGGNELRKEKIKVKNARLEEQRKRKIEQEKKEKARKDRNQGKNGVNGSQDSEKCLPPDNIGANDVVAENESEDLMGEMHPSRMARMQK